MTSDFDRLSNWRLNSPARQNPVSVQATATELRRAYVDAYSMIGHYYAGGEAGIRRELTAIVDAVFRVAGL